MMNEMAIQSSSGGQQERIDQLAQAIMNAMISGEETDKDSTLSIFLLKMFKNNSAPKTKKMNTIRLSRLNAFLYKSVSSFPLDQCSMEVLLHTVWAVLLNERNWKGEDSTYCYKVDDQLWVKSFYWMARVVTSMAKSEFLGEVSEFMSYLLSSHRPTLLDLKSFEQALKLSVFRNAQLSNEQQLEANKLQLQVFSLGTINPKNTILQHIDIIPLYYNLFQGQQKKKVIQNYLKHVTILRKKNKVKMFMDTFLICSLPDNQAVQAVLWAGQSSLFDCENIIQIIKRIISLTAQQILGTINLKGLKLQNQFTQSLLIQLKHKPIQELVQIFINLKTIKNYYFFYLIIKSEQIIPKQYCCKLLQPQSNFTNRKAIIFTLAILQNTQSHQELINFFFQHEKILRSKTKNIILRAIHFILQRTPKSTLYSHILCQLPVSSLDEQSTLQFLPICAVKPDITSQDKKKLLELLQRQFQSDEIVFKIKIDLYSVCGNSVTLLNRVNSAAFVFQKPIEQILKNLPTQNSTILEAVLMAVNNKLQTFFLEGPNQNILDWATKTYKKYVAQFYTLFRQFLSVRQKDYLFTFYCTLFEYNVQTQQNLYYESQYQQIVGCQNLRVVGTNFYNFFISQSKFENEELRAILEAKSLTIELKKLLKNLTISGDKLGNRKDLKIIVADSCEHALAFKLIHQYFTAGIKCPQLLRSVFTTIKSEFEFLELVVKQSQQINQDYYCILKNLPHLLKQLYPETIQFIAKLFDSKVPEKKKIKKKTDKEINFQYEKLSGILSCNLDFLLGDPNNLQSYEDLFKIIEKLKEQLEEHVIANSMSKWLSMVRIFHSADYQQWKIKAISLTQMWSLILPLISSKIQKAELQRHFLMLTDLLNTLYQKFRHESDMMEVEQKLLRILLSIYQLHNNVDAMDEESINEDILYDKMKYILLGYKPPLLKECNYYYCHTCSRSVCQICALFVHRIHDKTHLGKDGSCQHESGSSYKRQKLPNTQTYSLIGQNWPRKRQNEDIPEEILARQEMEGSEEINYGIHQEIVKLREEFHMKEIIEGRIHRYDRERDRERLERERERLERERDKIQRQRDREWERARERERLERERDKIERQRDREWERARDRDRIETIKQDKSSEIQDNLEIKNSSQISFKNEKYCSEIENVFSPAFKVEQLAKIKPNSNLKIGPIGNLLLRQLQGQFFDSLDVRAKQKLMSGHENVQAHSGKYIFFKSNSFKTGGNLYGGSSRQVFSGAKGVPIRRNIICTNKKFMILPSQLGVLVFSLSAIRNKFQRKETGKLYNEVQSDKSYLAAQPNNIQFQALEVTFSKSHPNLLAVVSQTQINFLPLNSDGKWQRPIAPDFPRVDNITRFEWVSTSKNFFAFSCNNYIKIGVVMQSYSVKCFSKISIDKQIKDFHLNLLRKDLQICALDVDGSLYIYQSQMDFKDCRNISITDCKINLPISQPVECFMIHNNDLILSLTDGTCILATLNNGIMVSSQFYDIKKILKNKSDLYQNVNSFAYLSNMKHIYTQDDSITIGCILKCNNGGYTINQTKINRTGCFCIIKINKNKINISLLNDDQLTDSYDISEINNNSYLIIGLQEDGIVWIIRQQISHCSQTIDQQFKINLNQENIEQYNSEINTLKLIKKMIYFETNRYCDFKQTKDITQNYKINQNQTYIQFEPNLKFKEFITGISFIVISQKQTIFNVKFMGCHYQFIIKDKRDIEIPFKVKQTLEMFITNSKITIEYIFNIQSIKNIKIYGLELNQQSVYLKMYKKLVSTIAIYHPLKIGAQQYLQNQHIVNLPKLNSQQLSKLLEKKHYSLREVNLLLKIQLLTQSLPQSAAKDFQGGLDQISDTIKCYLMPLCENRRYLSVSCRKLMRVLCSLQQVTYRLGHPRQYRTAMDLYGVNRELTLWTSNRTFHGYQRILTTLYGLIFRRLPNLYLIFEIYPNLMKQFSIYFKSLISDSKYLSKGDNWSNEKMMMVNVCSMYVALVCQYYQLLRNKHIKNPQDQILALLQGVFSMTKPQFCRQIIINPFFYLQQLYLQNKQPIKITSNINIFEMNTTHPPIIQQSDQLPYQQNQYILPEEASEMSEEQKQADQQAKQMQIEDDNEIMNEVDKLNIKLEDFRADQIDKQGLVLPLKQINTHIMKYLCEFTPQMIYYQFSFCIATSLFVKNDYLNSTNIVFYIGLLLNLLRIINNNMDSIRDRDYIDEFLNSVHNRINDPSHSLFFLVLNTFIQPQYVIKNKNQQMREVLVSKSNIYKQIRNFYSGSKYNLIDTMLGLKINKTSKIISMSNILKFEPFEVINHLYTLKYLGSLFVSMQNQNLLIGYQQNNLKNMVLFTVIKYNLRIYKNIMLLKKWKNDLQYAKIDVAFEMIQQNKQKGINFLIQCANKNINIFVQKLSTELNKINILQNLLGNQNIQVIKIIQLLNIFYQYVQ